MIGFANNQKFLTRKFESFESRLIQRNYSQGAGIETRAAH
jgi:hypothetical protein